tara:strand:+ start:403 stop:570 length:168 start_codon:yes stop_codon:yes gene_type:complete
MFDFAFNSFKEAIYMEGHGIFVWVVLCIVIMSLILGFLNYKSKLKTLKKKIHAST